LNQPLTLASSPELVFGLVAPIGVDLDLVTDVLEHTLSEVGYCAHPFRLTKLMQEVPTPVSLETQPYVQSYRTRIAYANAVRRSLGNEALAALAISAIRSFRAAQRNEHNDRHLTVTEAEIELTHDQPAEEAPIASQAYILRQLKRPEEITLLRRVYGKQFILVSAFSPMETRKRRIADLERRSRGGLISEVEAQNLAHALVTQDSIEPTDKHGQDVSDAFPLGDVFIDASSKSSCDEMMRRFVQLLFGNNAISPTRDEYGMYLAKSASLRSSDFSRQVGCAIFNRTGEVAALGCNEVPKAGGGTYWGEEEADHRDFVEGHDPNEIRKMEILVDFLDRLKEGKHLSSELALIDDAYAIGKKLLEDDGDKAIRDSQLMDLIEFARVIHAEMSALSDAARNGVPLRRGTLYCTTFPCHICAKHVVAAGIKRVVYLEPYPKSYALELHRDSIALDDDSAYGKVRFQAFIGVSPFRYRDLFEKGRRKYAGGLAQEWYRGIRRPMVEVYYPSYFKAEAHVVGHMKSLLEAAAARNEQDPLQEESDQSPR
jgi:deoxycytidylate deaminase